MSDGTNLYHEVSSAFWGSGVKVDRVTSSELKKAKKILDNHARIKQKIQEVTDTIEGLDPVDITEDTRQDLKALLSSFKRVISVYEDYGLWPSFNKKKFLSKHQEFVSIVKLAAEALPFENVLPKVLKWSDTFPRIIFQAEKELEEEKDKTYVNGLYRLLNDTLLDENGILTLIDNIGEKIGIEKEKGDDEKKKSNPQEDHKRVRWFGEKGAPQIFAVLKTVSKKRLPPEGDPSFNEANTKIESVLKDTLLKEWDGRIKKALDEFGFHTDGTFDKNSFEKKNQEFESFVKLASGSSTTLEELQKQVAGVYASYQKAITQYNDNKKMQDSVAMHFHNIVLDGNRNLYNTLKETHSKIKEIPEAEAVNISGTTPLDKSPQNEEHTEEKKEDIVKDKQPQVKSEDTEKKDPTQNDRETGGLDKEPFAEVEHPSHQDIEVTKEDARDIATLAKKLGSLTRAMAKRVTLHETFSIYNDRRVSKDPDLKKKVDSYIERIFDSLDIDLPQHIIKSDVLLRILTSSEANVVGKILTLLDARVDYHEMARVTPEAIARAAQPLVGELLEFSKKLPTEIEDVSKKNETQEVAETTEATPNEKPSVVGEAPPPVITEDTAVKVTEDIAKAVSVSENQETTPPQNAILEKVLDVVEEKIEEKDSAIEEAEGISKDSARQLMESIHKAGGDDITDTLAFVKRGLSTIAQTIGTEVETPDLKKDLLQACSSLFTRISEKSTKIEDTKALQDVLESFGETLNDVVSEHTDEVAELKRQLNVIRQISPLANLTNTKVLEIGSLASSVMDKTPNPTSGYKPYSKDFKKEAPGDGGPDSVPLYTGPERKIDHGTDTSSTGVPNSIKEPTEGFKDDSPTEEIGTGDAYMDSNVFRMATSLMGLTPSQREIPGVKTLIEVASTLHEQNLDGVVSKYCRGDVLMDHKDLNTLKKMGKLDLSKAVINTLAKISECLHKIAAKDDVEPVIIDVVKSLISDIEKVQRSPSMVVKTAHIIKTASVSVNAMNLFYQKRACQSRF